MAKHKPRQFWAAHVAAAQASRTSKADYCREHGLDYKTLLRWISRFRFRGAVQTQTQMQSLVPMAIRGTQATDYATMILRTRRLHAGRFVWPRAGDAVFTVSTQQFEWLCCGVDWQRLSTSEPLARIV